MLRERYVDGRVYWESCPSPPGEEQFPAAAAQAFAEVRVQLLRAQPAEQFLGQWVKVERCLHDEHDLTCACALVGEVVQIEEVGYRTDGLATFGLVGNHATRLIQGEFDRRH